MTLFLFAVASSPSSATCSRSCVRSRCCSTSRWAGIGGQRVTWPQYSSLIGRLTSILTSDWSPHLNTHLWLVASPQYSPLIGAGGRGEEPQEAAEGGDGGGGPEAEAGHHPEQEHRPLQPGDQATQVSKKVSPIFCGNHHVHIHGSQSVGSDT